MKHLCLSLICLLTGMAISAQYTFVKQWDHRFGGLEGDALTCFKLTSDGGFILGGWTVSGIGGDKTQDSRGPGLEDYWIVKIDSVGHKQWDKRFGTTSTDILWTLTQTSDNGFLLGGKGGGANGDKTQLGKGGLDYWVVKINANGDKLWDKTFGGSCNDELNAVTEARDKGYLLGGWSCSGISGDRTEPNWDTTTIFQPYSDYWVVKTDSAGHKEWDKRYGGIDGDVLTQVLATNDRGFILGGYSLSDSTGDRSQNNWGAFSGDYWIVKIDSNGEKQWDRRYGGTNSDRLIDMAQTRDGGYVLAGRSSSGINGDKTTIKGGYWIVKIDSAGNKEWDSGFDGSTEIFTVQQTIDDGYLLSGITQFFQTGPDKTENNLGQNQSWIVKTDALGHKQWDKTIFTSNSYGGYAYQTPDGCYAVANSSANIGGYKTEPSWGDSTADYWVLKFCMEPFNGVEPGTQNQGQRQIHVWPNPFTTDLSIALLSPALSKAEVVTFTITNLVGQTVYHRQEDNLATDYTKMLDLSYLPNGVYFVEVVLSGGKKFVEKVVKQ